MIHQAMARTPNTIALTSQLALVPKHINVGSYLRGDADEQFEGDLTPCQVLMQNQPQTLASKNSHIGQAQ